MTYPPIDLPTVPDRAQSAEDLASADYLRRAGDFAVTQSYLSAATDIAGGISKGLTSGPFKGSNSGDGTGFSLVRTGGLY